MKELEGQKLTHIEKVEGDHLILTFDTGDTLEVGVTRWEKDVPEEREFYCFTRHKNKKEVM